MSITFHRQREDFTCDHCGSEVHGDGYTNHCPRCLWSRHVDDHPGDRASSCAGMMEPITVVYEHDLFRIRHRCTVCGVERWNRAAKDDDRDVMLKIVAVAAKRLMG